MHIIPLHRWDMTPKEAVQLQRELAGRVDSRRPLAGFELVAGADISYNKFNPTMYACVIVYRVSDGAVIEKQTASCETPFPYVPGLLTFREAPALLEAFAKLKSVPDVIILDGQGLAHPRRFGLASHIGYWLQTPTVGCAKSLFVGTYKKLGVRPGALARLMDKDEQIGFAVRTRRGVKPVFVSVGHRIDLASAVRVVLATTRGYRIPEPTRLAHLRVNELRRAAPC